MVGWTDGERDEDGEKWTDGWINTWMKENERERRDNTR